MKEKTLSYIAIGISTAALVVAVLAIAKPCPRPPKGFHPGARPELTAEQRDCLKQQGLPEARMPRGERPEFSEETREQFKNAMEACGVERPSPMGKHGRKRFK